MAKFAIPQGKIGPVPYPVAIIGGGLAIGLVYRYVKNRNAAAVTDTSVTGPTDTQGDGTVYDAYGNVVANPNIASPVAYSDLLSGGGYYPPANGAYATGGAMSQADTVATNILPSLLDTIKAQQDALLAAASGRGGGADCGAGTHWDASLSACVPNAAAAPTPIHITITNPTGNAGGGSTTPPRTWNCTGGTIKDARTPGRCYCPKDKPYFVNGQCRKTRR